MGELDEQCEQDEQGTHSEQEEQVREMSGGTGELDKKMKRMNGETWMSGISIMSKASKVNEKCEWDYQGEQIEHCKQGEQVE